jgi:hypothetical protein
MTKKIEMLKDVSVAPFGTKVVKAKKGEILIAADANADAWIESKLAKEVSEKKPTKNKAPKEPKEK